jgi:hypothetical protein
MALVVGGAVVVVAGIGVYKYAVRPMWLKYSLRSALHANALRPLAEFGRFWRATDSLVLIVS